MLYPHSSLSVCLSHGLSRVWQANSAWLPCHLSTTELTHATMSGFIENWGEGGKRNRDRDKGRERQREICREREGVRGSRRSESSRTWAPLEVAPWGVWTPEPGSQLFKDLQVWCGNCRIIRRQGTGRLWRSISVVALWMEARGSSQPHWSSFRVPRDFTRSWGWGKGRFGGDSQSRL